MHRMSSDLVSASAQLRKFHGLLGKTSKGKALNSSDFIDKRKPRALVSHASGAPGQGCNAGATTAKDDDALAELQRYINEPRTATTAPPDDRHNTGEILTNGRLEGSTRAPVASHAAAPNVEVGGVSGYASKLTCNVSPLRRRVEATSTIDSGTSSPLSRALADFEGAVGGRGSSKSCHRGYGQASTGAEDFGSSHAFNTPEVAMNFTRTLDDARHYTSESNGAGSPYGKSSRVDDLSWSFEHPMRKLEPGGTGKLTSTSTAPAPISVSTIRSTYRRRRRKEERRVADARGPRRAAATTTTTNTGASFEMGDSGNGASRPVSPPMRGTQSSELEAAHPEAKVIDGLSYNTWVHDPTQRLDIISTTRAALKSGNAVVLRAALFDAHLSSLVAKEPDENDGDGLRNYDASVAADMRAEALRCARLVLQSLVNEVLTNSNCIDTPPISFWGPSPDQRYAEVLLEPHRRYIEYRAAGLS